MLPCGFYLLVYNEKSQKYWICNSLGQLCINGKHSYEMNLNFWYDECFESRLHSEWLKVTLYHFPELLREKYNNGSQLIHYSAQKNRMDLLKILVEYKADISVNGSCNISTLSFGLNSKNVALCRYLLENNASVNVSEGGSKNTKGWYPIHWAAKWSNLSCVQLLLENNANPFVLTQCKFNVLDIALNSNNLEVYKFILEHFYELANQWNISFTIEFRTLPERRIFFVIDENHLYAIPSSLADLRI